ncbi:unnamed protein product [Mycena citricolor]|uniref:Aminodeoxychorismate lyase n=1 Tax=Mycena citricolor TaxID=2018698 RepID=A0AAD2HQ20_9AGAR|nr:unnamed protein product [Mycena citricolor]
MDSYLLLTTTRYDQFIYDRLRFNDRGGQPSRYLLLDYHVERLLRATEDDKHGWPEARAAITFENIFRACEAAVASQSGHSNEALKIRITVSRTGVVDATASSVGPSLRMDPTSPSFSRPLTDSETLYGPPMSLLLDTQPTPPNELFSSTKTTQRALYDAARVRVGLIPTDSDADVIMYNTAGEVTESSVSNVAFYRNQTWITPPLASGCLPGVLRQWLLRHKRIKEAAAGELKKGDVHEGDWLLLFNSVRGCRLGRIRAA